MPDIGLVLGLLAEISAQVRMARAALARIDAIAAETRASPEAVDRVTGLYAGRIEQLERRRHTTSRAEPAGDARLHTATHDLLDRLRDVERAELQRMQNSAAVDNVVVRHLQRSLDLLRLRDRI